MEGKRHVSPRYPSLDLEVAVERGSKAFKNLGRGAVNRGTAIQAMGLSPTGSGGLRAVASMLSYGLWEKAGAGRIAVSENGRRIFAAQNPDLVRQELAQAALRPASHRKVYDQWPTGLPDADDGILGVLRMDWDFNDEAARRFLAEVRRTFDFAKVYDGEYRAQAGDDVEDEDDAEGTERPAATPANPSAGSQAAPVATPKRANTGDVPVELTSWSLEGGGRIVLELKLPLTTANLRTLATIDEAIREHLAAILLKTPAPAEPQA